jgi:N utilization substance protein A
MAEAAALEAEVAEAAELEAVTVGEPAEAAPEPEEELGAFDQLFSLRPEVVEFEIVEDDEEETDERKKKRKKKKKFVEMEYDPERNAMVVKKKRKRGDVDWDEKWDY